MDYNEALEKTWRTLSSSGFTPHETLVPATFKADMARSGRTFTSDGTGETVREALQAKRKNPAARPNNSYRATFRDRDKRRFEWDKDIPAGPPAPPTPELPPPSRSRSAGALTAGSRSRPSIGGSDTLRPRATADILTLPAEDGERSRYSQRTISSQGRSERSLM